MKQRVYRPFRNVDELKKRLVEVWSNINDTAINEWRKHLRACVRIKDGYFEYLL